MKLVLLKELALNGFIRGHCEPGYSKELIIVGKICAKNLIKLISFLCAFTIQKCNLAYRGRGQLAFPD